MAIFKSEKELSSNESLEDRTSRYISEFLERRFSYETKYKEDIDLRKWCVELISKNTGPINRKFNEDPELLFRYIKTGRI